MIKSLTKKSLAALFLITSFSSFAAVESSPWIGTKAGEKESHQLNIPKKLAKNLATFDELDFHVYSKQDWANLHKSHAANILVHYPN